MKVIVIGKCDDGTSFARSSTGDNRILWMQQIGHIADIQCIFADANVRRTGDLLMLQHDAVAGQRINTARLVRSNVVIVVVARWTLKTISDNCQSI